MSARQELVITERRPEVVRLPRADAAFLAAHARGVVDVVPQFRRGCYRLTPGGYVGRLQTPNLRVTIRPKIPWPNVALLLGARSPPPPAVDGESPDETLLNLLARELANRLRDVATAGLVRGYSDADHDSPFLRGRLRTADHMRAASRSPFPTLFPVTESVFDLDTPWNRAPKAVAAALADAVGLATDARTDLAAALASWADVPAGSDVDADLDAAELEPRATGYRHLLELCRLVRRSFRTGGPVGRDDGFLLDLGQAFERYVGEGLAARLAARAGWGLEQQSRHKLAWPDAAPLVLRPDFVGTFRGEPRVVLDAKWKRMTHTPDPADVHQALAYATLVGVPHVGLVYPGRRFEHRSTTVGAGVRLSLVRLRVTGSLESCGRSLTALVRACVDL